jgi:hypothetical protein
MKICWDMLEGVHLTKNGNFSKGNDTYIEVGSCAKCGEPYLALRQRPSKFCSIFCVQKNKIISDECKKKLSIANTGKVHTAETRKKMSKSRLKRKGSLSPCYRGGVTEVGLITYDTCKDKLGLYEEIREQEGTKVLEVRCTYCNKWYAPKWYEVRNRLTAINNLDKGEQRLYCSEYCKLACPTYKKVKYSKSFKHVSSREVNPYLRQTVLERDNWTCQICGKTIKEAQLHVHHMDPVAQNPMFQNDADSCVTLCKGCHKMVHSRIGCRYVDLQCKTETDYTKNFKEEIRLKSMNFQE